MGDLIAGILVIAGSYVGSAVFAIALFRVFFPLKTKTVKENKLTFSYTRNGTANSSTKNKVQMLSIGERGDWVKVNS
jgi:hypothetical protein